MKGLNFQGRLLQWDCQSQTSFVIFFLRRFLQHPPRLNRLVLILFLIMRMLISLFNNYRHVSDNSNVDARFSRYLVNEVVTDVGSRRRGFFTVFLDLERNVVISKSLMVHDQKWWVWNQSWGNKGAHTHNGTFFIIFLGFLGQNCTALRYFSCPEKSPALGISSSISPSSKRYNEFSTLLIYQFYNK